MDNALRVLNLTKGKHSSFEERLTQSQKQDNWTLSHQLQTLPHGAQHRRILRILTFRTRIILYINVHTDITTKMISAELVGVP